MDTSRRFAGFIGPVLIALAASETVTSHIWAGVPPTQVYLAGTLWLVAGIFLTFKAYSRASGSRSRDE